MDSLILFNSTRAPCKNNSLSSSRVEAFSIAEVDGAELEETRASWRRHDRNFARTSRSNFLMKSDTFSREDRSSPRRRKNSLMPSNLLSSKFKDKSSRTETRLWAAAAILNEVFLVQMWLFRAIWNKRDCSACAVANRSWTFLRFLVANLTLDFIRLQF